MRKVYVALMTLTLIFMQNTHGEAQVVSELNDKIVFDTIVSAKFITESLGDNKFLIINKERDLVLNVICSGDDAKGFSSALTGQAHFLFVRDVIGGRASFDITEISSDLGDEICSKKLMNAIKRKAHVVIENDPKTSTSFLRLKLKITESTN
ncbi:MAG: hypothetical protein K1X29_09550 [Bdellovibrionales bacterium]|nr:hypothetical protein [Bdellovibrionales bacterium]